MRGPRHTGLGRRGEGGWPGRSCQDRAVEHVLDLVAKVDTGSPTPQPELDLGLPPRMLVKHRRRGNGVSEALSAVAEFHCAFDLPVETRPQQRVASSLGSLRIELLREEFEEFVLAVENSDVVAIADALADIVYVAYGSALTYGIDLDAVLREVHRANMSKLGPDGRPLMRADGKVLKPETYSSPDIQRVLLDQPPLFLD